METMSTCFTHMFAVLPFSYRFPIYPLLPIDCYTKNCMYPNITPAGEKHRPGVTLPSLELKL